MARTLGSKDKPKRALVMRLKQVYGEDILEKIYEYDAAVTIKRDGKTIDIQELKEIIRKIKAEEFSIQSTHVH